MRFSSVISRAFLKSSLRRLHRVGSDLWPVDAAKQGGIFGAHRGRMIALPPAGGLRNIPYPSRPSHTHSLSLKVTREKTFHDGRLNRETHAKTSTIPAMLQGSTGISPGHVVLATGPHLILARMSTDRASLLSAGDDGVVAPFGDRFFEPSCRLLSL